MPTIVEFRQYRSGSTCAHHSRSRSARIPLTSQIPLHWVGYALVLALILASLVFGPPTLLAGQAEVDCVPAIEHTD